MLDTRPRKVHRDVASMCVMPIGATNTLLVRDTEQVVRRGAAQAAGGDGASEKDADVASSAEGSVSATAVAAGLVGVAPSRLAELKSTIWADLLD